MSDKRYVPYRQPTLWFLWAFLAIKIYGTSLVAWSWWWLLCPVIPVTVLLAQRIGIL